MRPMRVSTQENSKPERQVAVRQLRLPPPPHPAPAYSIRGPLRTNPRPANATLFLGRVRSILWSPLSIPVFCFFPNTFHLVQWNPPGYTAMPKKCHSCHVRLSHRCHVSEFSPIPIIFWLQRDFPRFLLACVSGKSFPRKLSALTHDMRLRVHVVAR